MADAAGVRVTYDETEIVADAGVRLRIIADGLLAGARMADLSGDPGAEYMRGVARQVDETRVRLCALPLASEGEAA